jgi:hypothetical protein
VTNDYFNLIDLTKRAFTILDHNASAKNVRFKLCIDNDADYFKHVYGD